MKCKTHRTYKGIQKPRTDCPKCWKVWSKREADKLARAVRDINRILMEEDNADILMQFMRRNK